MKVMQILTDTNVGGAGIWLLNYLGAYDRERIDMATVLPEKSRLTPMVTQLGCGVIELPGIADRSFSPGGIMEFKKVIEREQPDIIHTHACISARIAGRMKGVHIVNTRHCIEEPRKFPMRGIYRIINNSLSDIVIAVSEAVSENLIADGIKPDKVRVIYNGIRPLRELNAEQKAAARRLYGLGERDIVIGIVARLEPVKNHMLFLEAARFASLVNPHIKFMVVGTGSLEMELKKTVNDIPELKDRVIFTGYIQDVNDVMNVIDIHVNTSVREALCIALIEGMSLGKPCITTDSGGTREVVEHGKNGLVVPNNDAVNLSLAMIDLAQNARKRALYGTEGRRIARERFSVKEMAEKIGQVYSEFMDERKMLDEID